MYDLPFRETDLQRCLYFRTVVSKLLWSVVRSALPQLVVIYLQFLPEMPGFVACGDLSENAGVLQEKDCS